MRRTFPEPHGRKAGFVTRKHVEVRTYDMLSDVAKERYKFPEPWIRAGELNPDGTLKE